MNSLDSLLKRNKDFAASQSAARELMPRALPNVKAIIIGCADMRVDPAHVLGISWVYSEESVKLPKRFQEVAGSFISS